MFDFQRVASYYYQVGFRRELFRATFFGYPLAPTSATLELRIEPVTHLPRPGQPNRKPQLGFTKTSALYELKLTILPIINGLKWIICVVYGY